GRIRPSFTCCADAAPAETANAAKAAIIRLDIDEPSQKVRLRTTQLSNSASVRGRTQWRRPRPRVKAGDAAWLRDVRSGSCAAAQAIKPLNNHSRMERRKPGTWIGSRYLDLLTRDPGCPLPALLQLIFLFREWGPVFLHDHDAKQSHRAGTDDPTAMPALARHVL